MIGMWGAHTSIFLLVFAVGALFVFALPIFLVPLRWARVFGWSIPADSDLALYFGRCLGAVACVLTGFTIYVAANPALQPFFLQLQISVFLLMTWVHVLGAIQGVQPLSESLEIAFWGGLVLLALAFYPTLPLPT